MVQNDARLTGEPELAAKNAARPSKHTDSARTRAWL